MPIRTAGVIMPRARFDWFPLLIVKWRQIIQSQGFHRRPRRQLRCDSRARPRIATSNNLIRCGVERGRMLERRPPSLFFLWHRHLADGPSRTGISWAGLRLVAAYPPAWMPYGQEAGSE